MAASRPSRPTSRADEGRESFRVIALAASAGGLGALREILAAFPPDFGAAVLVVQHLDPRHESLMAEILGRECVLPVREAAEGDPVEAGTVLLGPPDRHLLVTPGHRIHLGSGERVHFTRPSADPFFASVAEVYRDRAVAVVLSGTGVDGSGGILEVKRNGGLVLVQEDAEFEGMPDAARASGIVDLALPLAEIAPALVRLTQEDVT